MERQNYLNTDDCEKFLDIIFPELPPTAYYNTREIIDKCKQRMSDQDYLDATHNAARIDALMYELGYVHEKEYFSQMRLNAKGREVKKAGGHSAYLTLNAKKESDEDEIQRLTRENLKLHNKELKTKVLYALAGGALALIVENFKSILEFLKQLIQAKTQ